MKQYKPKNNTIMAVQFETPPKRLHMTSTVYTYGKHEFSTNRAPVVGDYLIAGKLHMTKDKFESTYEEV